MKRLFIVKKLEVLIDVISLKVFNGVCSKVIYVLDGV